MKWQVMSTRLDWAQGTVLTKSDLAGCNIDMLVAAGHLEPVSAKRTKTVKAQEPDDTEEQGSWPESF